MNQGSLFLPPQPKCGKSSLPAALRLKCETRARMARNIIILSTTCQPKFRPRHGITLLLLVPVNPLIPLVPRWLGGFQLSGTGPEWSFTLAQTLWSLVSYLKLWISFNPRGLQLSTQHLQDDVNGHSTLGNLQKNENEFRWISSSSACRNFGAPRCSSTVYHSGCT